MRRIWMVAVFVLLAVVFVQAGEPDVQIIEGKVVDAAGAAIASVKVSLYEIAIEMRSFAVDFVESVETDETGAFSLSRPLREQTTLRQSIAVVLAEKPGLAIDWYTLAPGAPGECTLVLGESTVMAGKVVDEEGRPVAGAELAALMQKGQMQDQQVIFGLDDLEVLRAKTGPDGTFRFDDIPAGAMAAFIVTAPGMAKKATVQFSGGNPLPSTAGDTDIEIILSKAAVVEGMVVDKESGEGVGGVSLMIVSDASMPNPFEAWRATSDESGAFRAEALKGGATSIQLMPATEGIAEWVAAPVKVVLAAGETARDVKVELEKGGLLEVTAINEQTGDPAEGLAVMLQGADGQPMGIKTDTEGKGVVRLLPGQYTLRQASGAGYAAVQINEVVEVTAGETARARVAVMGPIEISGIILDENGEPVQGASVVVCPTGGSGGAETDADGRFTSQYNPREWGGSSTPNTYIVARHIARNLAGAAVADSTDGSFTLKLSPAATLSGKVIEPGETGVQGATINVMLSPEGESWGSSIDSGILTDAEGRYEVPTIPVGFSYDIYVSAAGHGSAQTKVYVDESGGLVCTVDDTFLDIADKSVSGTVVDQEGNPVALARVSASGQNQPHVSGQTDGKGAFTLEGLVEGQCYVSCWVGQDTSGSAQANAGDENVRIVVAKRETRPAAAPAPPPQARPLLGKPLPDLAALLGDAAAQVKGKPVVVCFFDANQRPSRHVLSQLSAKAAELAEKGVAIVAVDASGAALADVRAALGGTVDLPLGSAGGKPAETMIAWGVKGLPWLILADKEHVVRAEGFQIGELDDRLAKLDLE